MKTHGLFLVFILSLTVGLEFSYQQFRQHYSGQKDLEQQISLLKQDHERQILQQALLQGQIEEMRAGAYASFGQKKNLAWNEKQWWESLRGPASVPFLHPRAGSLLSEAKTSFRDQNYAKATETLKRFIREFPTSQDIIEAHFLLAESLYLAGQPEPSLDLIEQMMSRYPESELTGFIMLRMGQMLEKRNRPEEAKEVYETILKQFPRSVELRQQGERLMRALAKS